MTRNFTAIVVTHNSAAVVPKCLLSLSRQKGCEVSVIIVDNGSDDSSYLYELQKIYDFQLITTTNQGYARANNLGYAAAQFTENDIVFLNPDTYLPDTYLARAGTYLEQEDEAAVIAGMLEGYDPARDRSTGLIDSTGVFRRWYGRWYDRDQGRGATSISRPKEYLPAACGALLVCRRQALSEFSSDIFDADFFLYKEDIEFSLRIRKHGWKIVFIPELVAYHCRGWDRKRRRMSRFLRLTAAQSEILLYKKHSSPYILFAYTKYFLVRYLGL